VNRFIGLIVLCCCVIVGLGSIPGCPKKDTKKTTAGGGSSGGDKPAVVVTVPGEVDTAKDKTFEIKIERTKADGEGKVEITGAPKGVEVKADAIAAGKDKTTATITVDPKVAEAGTPELTIKVSVGETVGEAKTKLKIAKAGEPAPKEAKITIKGSDITVEQGKKANFDVTVTRENYDKDVKLSFSKVAGLTFKGDTIKAGENKANVEVSAAADAAKGDHDVTISSVGGDAKNDTKIKVTVK